jgi:hypothetical protein
MSGYGIGRGQGYSEIEIAKQALIGDNWTKEDFSQALRNAGTEEQVVLVTHSSRDALAAAAQSVFGMSESQFSELYGANSHSAMESKRVIELSVASGQKKVFITSNGGDRSFGEGIYFSFDQGQLVIEESQHRDGRNQPPKGTPNFSVQVNGNTLCDFDVQYGSIVPYGAKEGMQLRSLISRTDCKPGDTVTLECEGRTFKIGLTDK